MNELKPMFNDCVLMNDTAIHDQAVMNVLNKLSEDNFKFKNVSSDHFTFQEFINA